MGNMSYCRFENTFRDLQDCEEHIFDKDLSESEEKYRKRLINLCRSLATDAEDDDSEDE